MCATKTDDSVGSNKYEYYRTIALSHYRTEGAFWNYVGLGFVGGGFGGLNYAYSVPSSQRTYGGWAMAIGSGAVGTMITGTPFGATRTALYGGSIAYVGGQWSTSSWGRR